MWLSYNRFNPADKPGQTIRVYARADEVITPDFITQVTNMETTVLTLEQAAQYLQLSLEDLQTELEQGYIPGRKFRGQWRIHRAALDRLLGVHSNGDNVAAPTSTSSDNHDLAQNSIQEQVIADRSFPSDTTTLPETSGSQPAEVTDSSAAAADQKGSQGQVSTDGQH